MIASMGGTGNCYDDAVATSFNATIERELLMQSDRHAAVGVQSCW